MNMLICPDTFKGTLTALQAAKAIKQGLLNRYPDADYVLAPMGDGGAGTLEVIKHNIDAKSHLMKCRGPLGAPIKAEYLGLDAETCFIEMAQTSGLTILDETKKDPLQTTTYGVGQMILDAAEKGYKKMLIGLGGSATNDCGMGMAQALGVRFLDGDSREVSLRKKSGYSGKSLAYVQRIDLSQIKINPDEFKFIIASDVDNPLTGKKGATYVYGPQKGADHVAMAYLDKAMKHFADIIKKDIGIDVENLKGAGAAGGLGAGLIAFLGARVESGIDIVMDIVGFDNKVRSCDVIITGEGRIDFQTAHGKTISGIANKAKEHDKVIIAVGGCLGKGWEEVLAIGVSKVYDSSQGKDLSWDGLRSKAHDNLVKISSTILLD